MVQIAHIPNDSAPPGHFCLTTCPLVPSGHEIFQSASVSLQHTEASVHRGYVCQVYCVHNH